MSEREPKQVPATVNGEQTTVNIGRLGVSLLAEGTRPIITLLPVEYDFAGRKRTMFDMGDQAPFQRLRGSTGKNLPPIGC